MLVNSCLWRLESYFAPNTVVNRAVNCAIRKANGTLPRCFSYRHLHTTAKHACTDPRHARIPHLLLSIPAFHRVYSTQQDRTNCFLYPIQATLGSSYRHYTHNVCNIWRKSLNPRFFSNHMCINYFVIYLTNITIYFIPRNLYCNWQLVCLGPL